MLTPSDHCRIRLLIRHFDHSLFKGGNLLTYFNIVRAELQLVEVWRRNCRRHHYSNPGIVWDVGYSYEYSFYAMWFYYAGSFSFNIETA